MHPYFVTLLIMLAAFGLIYVAETSALLPRPRMVLQAIILIWSLFAVHHLLVG